ncbi:MAG: SCP2 sterol-binding domain-containing protein [Candidatus Bathyarchaeia archaeon]
MEAITPREFMEKVFPQRFNAAKAAGIDALVQVNIDGPNGGKWAVTIKDQKLDIKEGTHQSPKLSVSMKEQDFMDLMSGKLSGMQAFFSGKLQLKGDIGLAMRLQQAGLL